MKKQFTVLICIATILDLQTVSSWAMADKLQPIQPISIARPLTTMLPTVQGSVMKLDKRGISDDAEVEVQLSDVSRLDAPGIVLASQRIKLNGRQLPVQFALNSKSDLDPKLRYSLSATVYEGGKVTYLTDSAYLVTNENKNEPFKLQVRPVQSGRTD